MKNRIFISCMIATCIFSSIVTSKYSKSDTMTVQCATGYMKQEWQHVVILQGMKVLYSGNVHDLQGDILNMEVTEIANCDDTYAITLFVKE